MNVTVGWWWRFRVNHDLTWRERLATGLRRLAGRIDGRCSVAIEMHWIPALPVRERIEIIHKGMDLMTVLFEESTRSAAIESGLREAMPELYDEGDR